MTREYVQQTLQDWLDRDSGDLYEDVLIDRCVLDNACMLVNTVERRTTIRKATLRECTIHTNCRLGPVVVEDVLVQDSFKQKGSRGFVRLEGTALRHVTLRGPCVPLIIQDCLPLPGRDHEQFVRDNVRLYRDVDWALDITDAHFEELELGGVPGHLVRFDPRTAALVRRGPATDRIPRLKELGAAVPFTFAVGGMLRGPYDSVVVVASLLAPMKKRQEQLDALQRLRDEGIADPA